MADFATAYAPTRRHEGRWSNNPNDPGGETIFGISRNAWPSWRGWVVLDTCPRSERGGVPAIPPHVETQLLELAAAFYRGRFWDTLRGDDIPSQAVANELFDTGVNMHPTVPGRFLQETLNLMNNRGKRWPEIKEDGWIGEATLAALRAALARGYEGVLVKQLNHLQGAKYAALARANPRLEEFFIGWLART